ncbi:homoserine O-acetyltransferase [Zopfochytrium polystomum]|nr:homoserine O-acetyltransferase [Zopfochytrium polystomum]
MLEVVVVALSFPCIDKNIEREINLSMAGPEPAYGDGMLKSGFETFRFAQPFNLVHGGVLPEFTIAYESWGKLNAARDNVILLCTGLSASSHAKSHEKNAAPGWWEKFIGPSLPLDTDRFHIICTNVIGGCFGSTGPSSLDPRTGKPYGTTFPIVTLWDMVRAQFKMLDSMGISKLHACVGSSMGGMQSIAAAALYPDRIGKVVSISAAARSHPFSIALRFVQRQVLMTDPNWNRGFYYDGIPPHVGMKRANADSPPAFCPDYLIETYLDHQGEKFCLQYDANSLIYISKAMDMFDVSDAPDLVALDTADGSAAPRDPATEPLFLKRKREYHSAMDEEAAAAAAAMSVPLAHAAQRELTDAALERLKMPTLVVGCQSDILFPVWQQKEIVECLREAGNDAVTYVELDAMYGHDTFLIDFTNVGGAVRGHL